MRTIKFRGKHLCGQWYYGNLILKEVYSPVPETNQTYNCVYIGDIEDGSEEQVEEDTVGQFTGLYDKNGKEIYEDDILLNRHNRRYKVSWSNEDQRRILVNLLNADNYLNMYKNCMDDFEVISNIHDSPELLKGGEK